MNHRLVTKSHGFLHQIPKRRSPISHFHTFDKPPLSQSKLGFVLNEVEELHALKPHEETGAEEHKEDIFNTTEHLKLSPKADSKVQISHPWPEWIDLMELLLKKGLFQDGGGHPFGGEALGTKESNGVRTACLGFARDRVDLIRYLSRKDIRVIMESGCPSIDRKVVNSGKRLRAHVGIEEGKVCCICSLRGSCERAYMKAHEDEGGRTIDVMRILLTYGLDPFTGSVENKPCLNRKVKESVRRLLSQMVEFSAMEPKSDSLKAISSGRVSSRPEHSTPKQIGKISVPMKQGDWICPKCDFLNFAKNIKCLRCDGLFQERLRKLGENQDHLPLKRGDWLCDKCNFLNFAKNTRCLQCEEKPPKRHLNPGEWECESCNYINFRKNMVCLKCDWKRPKASNYSGTFAQLQSENTDFSQPHGMNFVRDDVDGNDQPCVQRERQSRKEGGHFLKYMGEDLNEEEDRLSPWNRFGDFPISGGKSYVSQNSQARERWKELSRKSRTVSRERHDSWDSQLPKNLEFAESTNDDDMEEWFGYRDKS